MNKRTSFVALIVGLMAVALASPAGAVVTEHNEIGSLQIRDNSVRSVDVHNGTVRMMDLRPALQAQIKTAVPGPAGPAGADGQDGMDGKDSTVPGPVGPQGPAGPSGADGQDGDSYFGSAYWSVAYYNAGNTNAGAIATVACKATTDTAVSGGVQVLGLDAGANSRNTPVSSSFPGRMDWSTNTPRPGRMDGWIIQFGGNAGTESDKAPEKVKVYALCVPGLTIPVEQTFTQAG